MDKKEVQRVFSKSYMRRHSLEEWSEQATEAYNFLRSFYRNEYFYKNTIFNRHVLGKRSLRTTTALQELRVGRSLADVVVINGQATVYEIKSEFDSFQRLSSQLQDYYKMFGYVYIVTSESQLEAALKFTEGTPTGVYVVTRQEYLSERKKAIWDNRYFCKMEMYRTLRKYEREAVIQQCGHHLPDVAPVYYFQACYQLWEQIPMTTLHREFLKQLKQRQQPIQGLKQLPYEVRSFYYFHYEK